MKVLLFVVFCVLCSVVDDILIGSLSLKDWKEDKKLFIVVLGLCILYGLADFIEDYMKLSFPLTLIMGAIGAIVGIIEAISLYVKTQDMDERKELLKSYIVVAIILILAVVVSNLI